MIRSAIRILLCLALLIVIAPFAISSLFIDQKGIQIPGQVYSKDERVVVHDTSWTRSLEVTVEYDLPHSSGVSFLTAQLNPDQFDRLKKGDSVQLHYLRLEDIPRVPGADALWQLHFLPTVRLADQRAWSGILPASNAANTRTLKIIVGIAVILLLWRVARIPLFGWAVAVCVLCAFIGLSIHEFPVPVSPPQNAVLSTSGIVKSLDRVDWLFRSTHQGGFQADQPIQIVGVQFVPKGRSEPVLAVDLIDADSVRGLQEHASITIDYERDAPRTARISGARRDFVRRNLHGIAVELFALLGITVILLIAYILLGKGYRRLLQRKSN